MDARRWAVAGVLASVLLAACANDDAAPPPSTPTVAQNNTYNNTVIYETSMIAAPAADASVGAAESSAVAPATSSSPPSAVIPPLPADASGTPRDLASTGMPECDAYLARVESCSRRLLPKNAQSAAAFHRITSSLDSTRRAWREAAHSGSWSGSIARTCADAMRTYNESVSAYCPL